MGETESLDYHVAHNELYREEMWRTTESDYRADALSRVLLSIAVGILVGFAAFVVGCGLSHPHSIHATPHPHLCLFAGCWIE
jgi:hypothetical protein